MLCGVLLLPLKLAATHAVVIVSFMSLFGAKHSFLAAGLSFLQAFFPIAPAFLIPVPWALGLVMEGAWVRGVLCFVGVKAALSWCDERVMRKQVGINPMFTSLSVLMGYKR
jgi:predicted PurR-regulated permease PerM